MRILFVSSGDSDFNVVPFVKSQEDSIRNNGVEVDHFLLNGKGIVGYLKNISRLKKYLGLHQYDIIEIFSELIGTFDKTQPDDTIYSSNISGNMSITFLDEPNRVNVHIDRTINWVHRDWSQGTNNEKIDYNGISYTSTYINTWDLANYTSEDTYSESGSSVSKISLDYSSNVDYDDGNTSESEYISHGTCSTDAFIKVHVYYRTLENE